MMLGTIVVVVVIARLTIDRFTTDVAAVNNVVIVAGAIQRDKRGIWMQRMVMLMVVVVIIDDERWILLD